MGPTASGKSELAESLADRLDADLISADAFQIYRGFDIGTAKPSDTERYHMIDIRDPTDSFGVGEFVLLACEILKRSFALGRNVVVVGGTGLYIRALFEEYKDLEPAPDPELRTRLNEELAVNGTVAMMARLAEVSPESARQIEPTNPRRIIRALEKAMMASAPISFALPAFRTLKFGLLPPLEVLDRSIRDRLRAMMQGGFIEEVQGLMNAGVPENAPAMQAIGYRTILRLIRGDLTGGQAHEDIEIETRRYAKRQRTWMRSEPRLNIIEQDVVARRLAAILDMLG